MRLYSDDHDHVVSARHIYSGGSEELTITRRDVLKAATTSATSIPPRFSRSVRVRRKPPDSNSRAQRRTSVAAPGPAVAWPVSLVTVDECEGTPR